MSRSSSSSDPAGKTPQQSPATTAATSKSYSFMSPQMLAVSKIIIAIAALVYHYTYFRTSKEAGVCPVDFHFGYASMLSREQFVSNQTVERGECFFPSDYEEGRARFRQAARKAGATDIRTMPVKDDLTTEVAIFTGTGADTQDNYLVHVSGTHGPEGYIGSAVQFAALEHLAYTGAYLTEEERQKMKRIGSTKDRKRRLR